MAQDLQDDSLLCACGTVDVLCGLGAIIAFDNDHNKHLLGAMLFLLTEQTNKSYTERGYLLAFNVWFLKVSL